MPAKYVVSHRARTGFQWQLVASNGRVIATSERFETRRAVLSSIESARKNAPTAVVEDAGTAGYGPRKALHRPPKPAKPAKPAKGAKTGAKPAKDATASATGDTPDERPTTPLSEPPEEFKSRH